MSRASPSAPRSAGFADAVRSTPIRWRILAIAVLNSAVAIVLLGLIWNGARVLGDAWSDLRRVRQSERFLATLSADAERLQSLIHRYFAQNDPDIHARVLDLRDLVISQLRVQARLDPLIAAPTRPLNEIMERLIVGFDELREARANIVRSYEARVVAPSRDMAGLYAVLVSPAGEAGALVTPALAKSRDAYNAMVLAANAFYLSGSIQSARETREFAKLIKRTAPVMLDLTGADEVQRNALKALAERADTLENGIGELSTLFQGQNRVLREAIDANTEAMGRAITGIAASMNDLEQSAQARFDRTLQDVAAKVALLALAFVLLVALLGLGIARSISEPLGELGVAMQAIMRGDLDRKVGGLGARDEIGQMARAVDVFRENAIGKRQAEEELRKAKERAETALVELKDAQASLIEAEKFAALGGLVAGVAHEVNNPVGISLTVASSLSGRCDDFAAEIASGQIRRSRLEDFTRATRIAADQLVANLHRAADLVRSFKQVAVDRSQAERRSFDLGEALDQILTSLRPMLKTSGVDLELEAPRGILMESYPGPLGQVVTNLFLNALHHAFEGRRGGTISVVARRSGREAAEILFRDDGVGMSPEVQRRAFDPFFTTRRGSGGTGLGLHIVYNLVTARLGGRVVLSSNPGLGSTFLIVLPVAPMPGASEPSQSEEAHV